MLLSCLLQILKRMEQICIELRKVNAEMLQGAHIGRVIAYRLAVIVPDRCLFGKK